MDCVLDEGRKTNDEGYSADLISSTVVRLSSALRNRLKPSDAQLHYGKHISVIVSPKDCSRCHSREVEEFVASHHSKAGRILGSLDNVLDAAYAMQQDDIEQVSTWAEAGQLGPVADEQARNWFDGDVSLWAVVVKPWVLVQEIEAE